MGMTNDEMYDWLYRLKSEILVFMPKEWHEPMRDSIQNAITFSRKYQMMQADYNARLKAELKEIKEEIIKSNGYKDDNPRNFIYASTKIRDVLAILDKKISELEGKKRMNLLEHYIDKIISEDKIQNPENGNGYYRVQAIVDCHGHKETINRLFLIKEWEQAKKQGYYMA